MKTESPVNNSYEDGWEDSSGAGEGENLPLTDTATPSSAEQGPCLFLGSGGERCSRRALEGGFCALHQPGGIAQLIAAPGRVFAATITIVVLLWPYIADLVREIIRWMAAH